MNILEIIIIFVSAIVPATKIYRFMKEDLEKFGLSPVKFSQLKCVICNGSLTLDFKIPNDSQRLFALVHDCINSNLTITISGLC